MREIKFRGKAVMSIDELDKLQIKHKNGWVFGNLITNGGNPFIVGDIADHGDEYIAHEWWMAVDPETVGQYSGIREGNSNPIYEDDLYRYSIEFTTNIETIHKKYTEVVKSENGAFMVGEELLFDAVNGDDDPIIIGNRFDDPELLEVNK